MEKKEEKKKPSGSFSEVWEKRGQETDAANDFRKKIEMEITELGHGTRNRSRNLAVAFSDAIYRPKRSDSLPPAFAWRYYPAPDQKNHLTCRHRSRDYRLRSRSPRDSEKRSSSYKNNYPIRNPPQPSDGYSRCGHIPPTRPRKYPTIGKYDHPIG